MKIRKKIFWKFVLLAAGCFFVFIVGILFGGSNLDFGEAIEYLFKPSSEGLNRDIIWQIRFPRVIIGLIVGGGLASSGTAFQSILRNPLAEPYTLGISGGAAFGVTASVFLSIPYVYYSGFAFLGGLTSIMLVYTIALKKKFLNSALILGGIILNFLFTSLIYFIFTMSKPEEVHSILMWLMGDLSAANLDTTGIVALTVIMGTGVLFAFSRDLNILTLGDEKAFHLGVHPEKIKKIIFISVSLVIGVCVSISGIIGFVGLIIPHFMRKSIGADHRLLLPASFMAGSIFLVSCDTLARVILQPQELPVGVITGILGGLFFLSLLLKSKNWEVF